MGLVARLVLDADSPGSGTVSGSSDRASTAGDGPTSALARLQVAEAHEARAVRAKTVRARAQQRAAERRAAKRELARTAAAKRKAARERAERRAEKRAELARAERRADLRRAERRAEQRARAHQEARRAKQQARQRRGGWRNAPIVTWYGPGFYGNRTACGVRYTRRIVGVAHRTLPCGTLVEFEWHGITAVAPVIDRGPFASRAYVFDFSAAMACEVFKPKRIDNACFTRYDVRYRVVGKVALKSYLRRQ
jgi:rare lipoprotein A (peptidoglycan hydrolase)